MSDALLSSNSSGTTRKFSIALETLYCVFFIVGIIENALVFHEIRKTKQRRKLTTNQLLMLHLVVVDILILMTLTPAVLYSAVDITHTSFITCRIMLPMVMFYPYIRVFAQVIIALERRRSVVTPLQPRFTTTAIVSMLSLCWLLSAVFTAPVVWNVALGPRSCGNDKSARIPSLRLILYTSKIFLHFVIPMTIITACYVQAGLALKTSRYNIFKASQMKSYALQREASRLQNKRVCKAFAIMVAVFAVCTAPLNTICTWIAYGSGKNEVLENQALYCLVANFPVLFASFLDPIIYGTFCFRRRGTYRSKMKKAWDKLLRRKKSSTSDVKCLSR